MQALHRSQHVLSQPVLFDTATFKDLKVCVVTLPGYDVLKKKSPRYLWHPIFIAAVESINKPQRDQGAASSTSTNQLLTTYMEERESQVKFARRRTALNV